MSSHTASHPSLCIPRVFPNITWKRVKACLESVGLGEIERIDMVPKTNAKGEKFQQVYVHFKKWATTPEAQEARRQVLAGGMFKVTYDDPWFWKIGMSRAKKPQRNAKKVARKPRAKPTMSFDVSVTDAPKKTTPDVSSMMREMESMRAEMERLRMAAAGSTTPVYQPMSPPYAPTDGDFDGGAGFTLTPPAVTRQTGADIARELELELEGTGVEECAM